MNSKIFDYFKGIYKGRSENYIFAIFTLFSFLILLKFVGSSAWLTIASFSLVALILWLKIRDLTSSFLLTTIFSLQFYVPNKYYIVEIFRPFDLLIGVGSYVLSYGVNLQNIFLVLTLVVLLRNLILKRWRIPNDILKKISPIIFSAVVFFFVSLYSSRHISPYPGLSTTWLLQFMQMFLISFACLCVYLNKIEAFKLIPYTIIPSILLQAVTSFIQFAKQAPMGIPVESFRYSSVYYGAPDAISSLFRVAGTFGGPNQLAIMLCAMLALSIPTILKTKKPVYIIISLVGVASIILTQSRSAWISLTALIITTVIIYKDELIKIVNIFGSKKVYMLLSLIVVATSISSIPRIIVSFNSFNEGAGAPLRTEMLKEAFSAFTQSPLVGYGVGMNEHILLKLFPNGYIYTFPAPVHTAYMQMLLESGAIGLIAFILPFVYIVRGIINKHIALGLKKMTKIKNVVFIAVSGMLTFGLFYLFQPHQGYLEFSYIGLILGYGILCILDTKKEKNEI